MVSKGECEERLCRKKSIASSHGNYSGKDSIKKALPQLSYGYVATESLIHTVVLQHNLLMFSPLCGAAEDNNGPRAASYIILMRTWKPSATQMKVAVA